MLIRILILKLLQQIVLISKSVVVVVVFNLASKFIFKDFTK